MLARPGVGSSKATTLIVHINFVKHFGISRNENVDGGAGAIEKNRHCHIGSAKIVQHKSALTIQCVRRGRPDNSKVSGQRAAKVAIRGSHSHSAQAQAIPILDGNIVAWSATTRFWIIKFRGRYGDCVFSLAREQQGNEGEKKECSFHFWNELKGEKMMLKTLD